MTKSHLMPPMFFLYTFILLPFSTKLHAMDTTQSLAYVLDKEVENGAENNVHSKKSDDAVRFFEDTLVTQSLKGCIKLMPDTIDIPPLDLAVFMGNPGRLTTSGCRIKGLSTVQTQEIRYSINDYGHLLISMPLNFTDLHVIYDRFEFDCWPLRMTGNADLKLMDNDVIINLKVIKISDVLSKIAKKECLFHFMSVTIAGFKDIEPKIKMDDENRHKFLVIHVFPVLVAKIKKVVMPMVEAKMIGTLLDTLLASSTWMCRDGGLKQLITEAGGPVRTQEETTHWFTENAKGKSVPENILISKLSNGVESVQKQDMSVVKLEKPIKNVDANVKQKAHHSEKNTTSLFLGTNPSLLLHNTKQVGAAWVTNTKDLVDPWIRTATRSGTTLVRDATELAAPWIPGM